MITSILIALAPATPEAAPLPPSLQPLDPALESLVQEPEVEADPEWTGSVSLSAVSTDGNTETQSFNFDSNAVLRRDIDRFTWKGFLNYGTDSSSGSQTLTQRKMGTSLKYDYFVNEAETTYVYGNLSAEYDALADLDLRGIAGAGMGYQFYEEPDFQLAGELGLTYISEQFEGGFSDEYAALRIAANLFDQLTEDLTLNSSAEAYPSIEDSDDVNGKLDTKLNMSLSESMFTSFQWVMDYDNTPSGTNDRVDDRFVLSLGWSF